MCEEGEMDFGLSEFRMNCICGVGGVWDGLATGESGGRSPQGGRTYRSAVARIFMDGARVYKVEHVLSEYLPIHYMKSM